MSVPDGFASTYACGEDTALYPLLVEAHRRGAGDFHVVDDARWADRGTAARFRIGRALNDYDNYEGLPCSARQMVAELTRQPPKGVTDPAMGLIHALTNDTSTDRDLRLEAVVDGETVRARAAFMTGTVGGDQLFVRLLPPRTP